MQEAVDLLQPLLTDSVDYVKQGALIATALVLMQQPESKVNRHCLPLSIYPTSWLLPATKALFTISSGKDLSFTCLQQLLLTLQ